jgi:hypothetical protein
MRHLRDFFRQGIIASPALAAAAIFGFLAVIGFLVAPTILSPVAEMRIEPLNGVVMKDNTFTIEIVVKSSLPVNVFAGELTYDPEILEVDSIDYNTSIADLWAERPWYDNGEGTLNFGGGTTRPGGFIGTGSLITVTFKSLFAGDGILALRDPIILQHDGLGTEAEVEVPIDALFTIESEATSNNVIASDIAPATYRVLDGPPSKDLNGDGKQSLADLSIFTLHMTSGNLRSDFNVDGKVDTKDLSIILNAR